MPHVNLKKHFLFALIVLVGTVLVYGLNLYDQSVRLSRRGHPVSAASLAKRDVSNLSHGLDRAWKQLWMVPSPSGPTVTP